MKYLLLLLLTLPSLPLEARTRQILKCLGEEEQQFHLNKDSGPLYELNQRLISEMIQIPRIEISTADFDEICKNKKYSASWKLLEQSIKKGKDLFIYPDSITGMQRSMAEGMVDDYIEATREILLQFINQVQMLSPTPTCLKEQIPELDSFFVEIKYLQEDVDLQQIFKGKDQKIFERLTHFPEAFRKCREALKKKVKSKSTARPKKS